ncbi:DMT family transporter [Microscilla marina]|uniref:Putative transmembrane permease n=1 Tax=Microscilla marina ATCC 23134 TaxID=313606 RepID=A1ZDH9_MICM2|nr:DMT family transporter [Microscilla marina]EAY31718.1 putative transmembrane permease [Microscilla marina ATCC 23134]
MNKTAKVHLALFTVNLIYATNYVVASKIMKDAYITPFAIILLRVCGASLLFWFFQAFTFNERVQKTSDYLRFAYCALFGVVINQLLFFKGLSMTVPIDASIILTSSPILVLLASVIILKEKVTWLKLLGIILGAIGAVMLIGGGDFSFKGENTWGNLLVLLNASSYSVYLVVVKPLMRRYQAFTVVKWVFLFGCIGVLPFGWSEVQQVQWSTMPGWVYLILGFIVVGVTFLAYLLNAWALRFVSSTLVAFYIYLQPVLTSIIAVLSSQDELTFKKVLFSLLIFTGIFLVSYSGAQEAKKRKKPEEV